MEESHCFGKLIFMLCSRYHKRQTTTELKLAGIALKQPKMLTKHHKFQQTQVGNSDVSLLLFLAPK